MHSLQNLSVVSVAPCEPFPSHTVPQRTRGTIGVIEKKPSLIQGLRVVYVKFCKKGLEGEREKRSGALADPPEWERFEACSVNW